MRSPYGPGGTPTDLGRVPYRATPRAYGLRSASMPTGYVAPYGRKPRATRKETINPTTNLVQHDDDAPRRKYVRSVTEVTDYAAERKAVGTIKMADF